MTSKWEGYNAPKGYEYHMPPGATEPQLRELENVPAAEPAQLKGRLPEDFPGYSSLEAAGVTTYAKVRKSLDSLEEIEGIGPATAEKIREAMNASSEAEEEAE